MSRLLTWATRNRSVVRSHDLPRPQAVDADDERTRRTHTLAIAARLATKEEATALQLGDGPAAVLVIHHTAFDAVGEPIEFAEAVFTPGRWSFQEEYPISG